MVKQTAIAFLFFSSLVAAADTPPPPFQLPTYREGNAHQPLLPIVRKPSSPSVKKFDPARAIELTANCWPAKSWFRPELSLEARGGQTFGSVGKNDQTQADYVGIVARIPLYSPAEIDREREREALRMQQAATNVGNIVQALVERHRAKRETELYEAIERRARMRVAEGVTETSEQVNALKQVADSHTDTAKAAAKLTAARLALSALCQRDRVAPLENYLNETLGALVE